MFKPFFTSEQLATIKKQVDPLLVPIILWTAHIENNSHIRFNDFLPTPENIQVADFIVTEKEWFFDVVRSLKNLHSDPKRIEGLWFVTKLEPKKIMPKIDIFEGGRRQLGSFRSKG